MLSFFSLQRPFPLLLMCSIIKAFDERVCPKVCDFLIHSVFTGYKDTQKTEKILKSVQRGSLMQTFPTCKTLLPPQHRRNLTSPLDKCVYIDCKLFIPSENQQWK